MSTYGVCFDITEFLPYICAQVYPLTDLILEDIVSE